MYFMLVVKYAFLSCRFFFIKMFLTNIVNK